MRVARVRPCTLRYAYSIFLNFVACSVPDYLLLRKNRYAPCAVLVFLDFCRLFFGKSSLVLFVLLVYDYVHSATRTRLSRLVRLAPCLVSVCYARIGTLRAVSSSSLTFAVCSLANHLLFSLCCSCTSVYTPLRVLDFLELRCLLCAGLSLATQE